MRGWLLLEVGTFSFHLGSGCALHGPATGFAREGGLQNCYRPSPDAALRLVRRETRDKPPSPAVRIRLQYVACLAERTELRMQGSVPPRRLAVRGCERAMRSIDGAQRNLRGGILPCIATIINNYCRKA